VSKRAEEGTWLWVPKDSYYQDSYQSKHPIGGREILNRENKASRPKGGGGKRPKSSAKELQKKKIGAKRGELLEKSETNWGGTEGGG